MKKSLVLFVTTFLVLVSASSYAADCNNGGRYENMNDGTVQDCRTGLIWLANAVCTDTSNEIANPYGELTWQNALTWVAGLGNGICGLMDGSSAGDWRLPTKTEWVAMVASAVKQGFNGPALTNGTGTAQWSAGNVFANVQSQYYWSSTTYAPNTTYAWYVYMDDGSVDDNSKSYNLYVWPVRGGQSGEFGSLTLY